MPRYFLFGGDQYYPAGGWDDFKGSFETAEDAWRAASIGWDWWHIVDTTSGEIVEDSQARRGRGRKATLSGPSRFVIMAKYPGQDAEEVDEATNLEEARFFVREYQMAYGPEWSVWYKRAR